MQGSGKVYKAVRNREECRSPCYPCNERKNLQPDRKKRSRKDNDNENASWIHCLQMILAVSEAHTCENSLEEHFRQITGGEGIAEIFLVGNFAVRSFVQLLYPGSAAYSSLFSFFLIKMLWGGLLLGATQTPLLYLTIRTKGFALPLIAIAAVILLNVILSSSGMAGFYPWSACYFLVMGRSSTLGCPKEMSLFLIRQVAKRIANIRLTSAGCLIRQE